MSFNKKFFTTGGIVASSSSSGPTPFPSNPSTTEWIMSDNLGNLFYTAQANGLGGWSDTGEDLGGSLNDAVYTGEVWIAATGNGVWRTTQSTGTSGWTKVAGGTTYYSSLSVTIYGIVATGSSGVIYTTDRTGATGWTSFPNLTGNYNYQRAANDGSQTFFGIWNVNTEYAYANDLFGSSSVTYLVSDLVSNDSRGCFYDPVNGYYFVYGKGDQLRYRTTIGGSYSSVNGGGVSANGYNKMEYNGSYYVTSGGQVIGYSTSATTSFTQKALTNNYVTDVSWNGTSWIVGTNGNASSIMQVRNSSNPSGTWTAIAKPSGFNSTSMKYAAPSKRPYYNTLTNLGF